MAQGKLSPRQKMINMMYLVLTALLALNVSKEIINAFVTVNESLVVTRDNVDNKNKLTYLAFDQAKKNDEKKYGQAWTNAQSIKKSAGDVSKFIEDLKTDLVKQVEDINTAKGEVIPDLREMGKKDNYDIPTYIMCGDKNDGIGFKATELKKKMNDFKTSMLQYLKEPKAKADFQARLENLLDTKDPDPKIVEDGKRTWEMFKFYHNPVVATVALLTKFQGDVKNAESQVIDHILSEIDAKIIKFDVLQPRAIAEMNYVLIGQDYKADVFLSASSSTLAPDVFIGAHYDSLKNTTSGQMDKALPIDAAGIAKYTAHPSAEGEQKWGGIIRVKKPDNTYEYHNFEQAYIAAKPAGVVSADKMNVLYIGVDNPMSISVPGVANDKVKTTPSGGVSLKPDSKLGGGHYIAIATTQGECVFTVAADFGGKQQVMGTAKYRVKRLPAPVAMIAGSKGGSMSKATLAAQSAIIPVMENFDFELFPKITGFRMTLYKKGAPDPIELDASDNRLTQKMQDAIRSTKVGDKVYFEYIKGSMPDGSKPSLSPIGFVLN